jgi:hypothetical protein
LTPDRVGKLTSLTTRLPASCSQQLGSFQTTKKARGKPTDGTEKPGKAPSKDVKKQLAYDAKVLWEESRNTNADHKQKREESMARLLELISGKMFDVRFFLHAIGYILVQFPATLIHFYGIYSFGLS